MVRIVTDSAADFEPLELKKLNVTSIPLSVTFGGRTYREGVDISKNDFFRLLENNQTPPRTSQPSPNCFEKIFASKSCGKDEILGIFLSSKISGTYYGAKFAKRMYKKDNCYIIDSLNASAGQRILVEYAVELRNSGMNGQEIYTAVEALKSRVRLYACVDTLKYLEAGGRMSRLRAGAGTIAHIKPVITMEEDGRPGLAYRALGIKRGIKYIINKFQNERPDSGFPVYIMYSGVGDNALVMQEALRGAGINIPNQNIINVGAVIGSHIGPNAVGIVYVTKRINKTAAQNTDSRL